MGNRSRRVVTATAEQGQAETIAINFILPFNATLLQVAGIFGGTPASEEFSIIKASGENALLNFPLRIFNPGLDLQPNVYCNEHFEFRKDDILVITYANTADEDVGVEAIFKEGD